MYRQHQPSNLLPIDDEEPEYSLHSAAQSERKEEKDAFGSVAEEYSNLKSPEQLLGKNDQDLKALTWQFGVLLYRFIANKLPTQGPSENLD